MSISRQSAINVLTGEILYRHSAINVLTGEIIQCRSGNQLKRALASYCRYQPAILVFWHSTNAPQDISERVAAARERHGLSAYYC